MCLFLESQENPTNHQKLLRGKEMEGERSLIKSFQHLQSLSAQVLEKAASEWVSWIPEFGNQFPKDSLKCRCHLPPLAKGKSPVLWDAPDLLEQPEYPMAPSNQG